MERKRGFTLVELLAVIVILAVIALIAVPVVLNLIEDSRKGSAKDTFINYLNAVEQSYITNSIKGNDMFYGIESTEFDGNICYQVGAFDAYIEVKGNRPSYDSIICFDEKYKIAYADGFVNNYYVAFKDNNYTVTDISGVEVEKIFLKNGKDKITELSVNLSENRNISLTVEYEPRISTEKGVTWKSSNENVATVEGGKVYLRKRGNVVITATTSNNVSASVSINVTSNQAHLIENKTYSIGESVNYASLNWYVLNQNDETVTLILKSNYKTGSYGTSTNFNDSNAYNEINQNFLNENATLKVAAKDGSLISQGTKDNKDYYVRLAKKEELTTPIANDSGTSFWTMTSLNDKMYYALSSGNVGYLSYTKSLASSTTCWQDDVGGKVDYIVSYACGNYKLNPINNDTLISPNETEVRIGNDVTHTTTSRGCTGRAINANCNSNVVAWCCTSTATFTDYTISESSKASIGYRPVITVEKNY